MNFFSVVLIQPLANGLILFYKLLGQNMGLALIAFTLFLKFATNPLTRPYMNSMKKIKDLSPQLEKLKERHKGDKVKFAQAQADLYKEKKVNPGAGCIPYILQIVVLIAFFNVFTKTIGNGGNIVENFNKLLYEPLRFSENESVNTKFLYMDISKPDKLSLPGVSFPLPGPILLLAAITQLISAKVMNPYVDREKKLAAKTKESSDDIQVAMQKSMMFTFPLFTILIGMNFASGLALYWLTFSVSQVVQQVRAQGWGELSPLVAKLKLIKSIT